MPPPTVEVTARTRGDDIHDYLHDAHDAATTPSSAVQDSRIAGVLRRSTTSTSDIVHDKYFIPGVVASGVFLAVALVCVFFLLRKRAKPPVVQWAAQTRLAPDMRQAPGTSMSTHAQNANIVPGPPGSPNGSRRLSHIQRKSLSDPPPGAESRAPPPEGPLYDVNGPYGAQAAFSANQNYQHQPSPSYHPQPPTVTFDAPPHGHGHDAQYQYSPYASKQLPYLPQNASARNVTAPSANSAPVGQWQQNQWSAQNYPGAPPTRVSILSTDQSATQVGSDKDYHPGGYGKMGAQAQKPLQGSDASPGYEEEEYFDPYGGIERGNTAGSRSQVRR